MFKTWRKPTREEHGPTVLSVAHRNFSRTHFDMPVRLSLGRGLADVRLLDISLQGALVEAPEGFSHPVGARGRLRVSLGLGALVSMDVVVARTQGHRLGLRRLHIDLDSLTHLRKMIEGNAEDPHLMGRDLARLIGMSSHADAGTHRN